MNHNHLKISPATLCIYCQKQLTMILRQFRVGIKHYIVLNQILQYVLQPGQPSTVAVGILYYSAVQSD